MGRFHDRQFPGESAAYRKARDELLDAEIALRKHIEDVAVLRRGLPPGGELKEDYVFEEGAADLSDQQTVKPARFSELFEKGKDSLIIYSFMYGPDWNNPCPMCVSLLDSLNGNAPHVQQRVNLAVVARAPIQIIRSWASQRGWKNLRLLSSRNNTCNTDYFAENAEDDQIPPSTFSEKRTAAFTIFTIANCFMCRRKKVSTCGTPTSSGHCGACLT